MSLLHRLEGFALRQLVRVALHCYHRDLLRRMTTGPMHLRHLYAGVWTEARRAVRKTNNTKEVSNGPRVEEDRV